MRKLLEWYRWLRVGWIPRWLTKLLGLRSPSEDLLEAFREGKGYSGGFDKAISEGPK